MVGRGRRTLHDTGFDQEPGTVADRGQRLSGLVELPYQLHRLLLHPQQIRVDLAARNDQGVVFVRVDVFQILVDWDFLAPVLHVPAANYVWTLAVLWRSDMNRRTRLAQLVTRYRQLQLLDAVGRHYKNSCVLDVHDASPLLDGASCGQRDRVETVAASWARARGGKQHPASLPTSRRVEGLRAASAIAVASAPSQPDPHGSESRALRADRHTLARTGDGNV